MSPITIERFISDQQNGFPEAKGDLTRLLHDMALCGGVIAGHARRAGLGEALGKAGGINSHGDEQMRLDVMADSVIYDVHHKAGPVAVMASEERREPILVSCAGKYVLLYDPLDGSSNIDVNVSVGTIFSVLEYHGGDTLQECLKKGRDVVAAGYVIYGPSTMMVYSAGQGVHGFTLDDTTGEFLLTHPSMMFPDNPKYYSANHANESSWDPTVRAYVDWLRGRPKGFKLTQRWVGSLVADFHRNLLAGGTFCYPCDEANKEGKLRLLYEAIPLAFLAEQAGGLASGRGEILDIEPESLHQKIPLFIGDARLSPCEYLREQDAVRPE